MMFDDVCMSSFDVKDKGKKNRRRIEAEKALSVRCTGKLKQRRKLCTSGSFES